VNGLAQCAQLVNSLAVYPAGDFWANIILNASIENIKNALT